MIQRWLVGLLTGVIAGCGPGMLDYEEKIGDTGLIFVDTNSANMFIAQPTGGDDIAILVDSSVIAYRLIGHYVVGTRQVINHYACNDPANEIEVTDRLQFFVIDASAKRAVFEAQFFDNFEEFKSYVEAKSTEGIVNVLSPSAVAPYLLSVHAVDESGASDCTTIN